MFRVLLSCRASEQTAQEVQQVVTAALEGLAAILVFPGSVTQPSKLRRQCPMIRQLLAGSLQEHSNQTNHRRRDLSLPLLLGVSVTQGPCQPFRSAEFSQSQHDLHITHAQRTAGQRLGQGSKANTRNHST